MTYWILRHRGGSGLCLSHALFDVRANAKRFASRAEALDARRAATERWPGDESAKRLRLVKVTCVNARESIAAWLRAESDRCTSDGSLSRASVLLGIAKRVLERKDRAAWVRSDGGAT